MRALALILGLIIAGIVAYVIWSMFQEEEKPIHLTGVYDLEIIRGGQYE